MGCSDGNEFNNSHSFNTARNFHPLIPTHNTYYCPENTTVSTLSNPPNYNHSCNLTTNFSTVNNHHLGANNGTNHHQQQSMKEVMMINEQPLSSSSSRWNPTAEQLLALEELYRCGTRTPTAEQIQQIATRLRRFGKIEGKNVFYWFQNHKARERQKRRREVLEINSHDETKRDMESLERKETGLRRTGYEVENTKSRVPSSSPSKITEELIVMHGAEIAAESGTDGWAQFEERELQQRMSITNRKPTWSYNSPPMQLINTMSGKTSSLDSNLLNSTQHFSSSLKPNQETNFPNLEADQNRETQTLQLFPLHRNDINVTKKDTKLPITTINTNFTSNQYFEFLPLKK